MKTVLLLSGGLDSAVLLSGGERPCGACGACDARAAAFARAGVTDPGAA